MVVLLMLLLVLAGCGGSRAIAVEVWTDSIPDLSAALALRVPECHEVASAVVPAGLWNELDRPAGEIAVLGYDAAPGPWRVSYAELAGQGPSRNRPPLDDLTQKRLARFFRDVRRNEAVLFAPREIRARVLAAHATRALGTEIVARERAAVLFARFDARAPGLSAYCADAVRDLIALQGPRYPAIVWLRDGPRSLMMACGPAANRLSSNANRSDIVAAIMNR